jgi:hypothetical protein
MAILSRSEKYHRNGEHPDNPLALKAEPTYQDVVRSVTDGLLLEMATSDSSREGLHTWGSAESC